MEKYSTAGQVTDDNIIRCMRVACWITKTTSRHSEYVTYCFSTATIIAWMGLTVVIYVHCLSCFCFKSLTVWSLFNKRDADVHRAVGTESLQITVVTSRPFTAVARIRSRVPVRRVELGQAVFRIFRFLPSASFYHCSIFIFILRVLYQKDKREKAALDRRVFSCRSCFEGLNV